MRPSYMLALAVALASQGKSPSNRCEAFIRYADDRLTR